MSRLFLLVAAVASCSAPAVAPAPLAPTPAEPVPPIPAGPEIVEVPTDPTPTDCVAAASKGGLLDQTSTFYRRIEVKQNGQGVEEKAWLAASDVIITAGIGGCAHFGTVYYVDMASSLPVEELATHLEAAMKIVATLPHRVGTSDYRTEIFESVRSIVGDAQALEACYVQRGEIDSVMCGVSETEPGRVVILLGYDVAL